MGLDQSFHSKFASQCKQLAQVLISKDRNNQQKCVCVRRTRFPYLPRVDDKIFPQNRKLRTLRYLLQVSQRTLKKVLFCQNGKRHGAARFQFQRSFHWLVISAQEPSRRRSLFQLCDDIQSILRQGRHEIAHRSGFFLNRQLQRHIRQHTLAVRNRLASSFHNSRQDTFWLSFRFHHAQPLSKRNDLPHPEAAGKIAASMLVCALPPCQFDVKCLGLRQTYRESSERIEGP